MHANRFLFLFSTVLIVFVLAGAPGASARRFPWGSHSDSKKDSSSVDATRAPSATPAAEPADVDKNQYIIGPEDVIAINVWKENDMSRTLPVRPDGKFSLPLVGEIQARGLTPAQLQAQLEDKLKAYFAHPQVTVMVMEVKSQRFNIVGEVLRPGSYDLAKPMTVLDAIALAGGFQEFAKSNKTYVLRKSSEGSTTRIPFRYKDVVNGRDLASNVSLHPGDTIIVP